MQTCSDYSLDERQYLERQIEELQLQCNDTKRFKQDLSSRDRKIRDLEHSLDQCSQRLITAEEERVAAESRLKSCQAAALEERDRLEAENLSLCNTNDDLLREIYNLTQEIKDLQRRLHTDNFGTPASTMPLQSPLADASPATPMNELSLEEELATAGTSLSEEPISGSHIGAAAAENSSRLMKQETRKAVLGASNEPYGLQSQRGNLEIKKFRTVCGCCIN
ncbi:hypothetical protein BKA63DRAFT_527723, partial [Paraphoma chrysanthemicola]